MKSKKYTEEQIIAVLREGEAGVKVVDLCRKYGISDATYHNLEGQDMSSGRGTPLLRALMGGYAMNVSMKTGLST